MNTECDLPAAEDELADWARLIEEMEEIPSDPVEIQADLCNPHTRDPVRRYKP